MPARYLPLIAVATFLATVAPLVTFAHAVLLIVSGDPEVASTVARVVTIAIAGGVALGTLCAFWRDPK